MKSIWVDSVPQTTNPLAFFVFVSRPHWKMAAISTACVVVGSVLTALVPYIYKLIIDSTAELAAGSYDALWHAILLYVLIVLASNLIWRGSGFAGLRWATGARATARAALNSYVTLHSHQYFSERFAGAISNKIKQAGDGMRDFVEAYLWQFLGFVVSVIASFIIVFSASPLVGLLLLGLFAVITPLNLFLARRRIPLSYAAQSAETTLNGASVDMLTNITAVHDYARRSYELSRLMGLIDVRRIAGARNWQYGEWVLVTNNLIQALFTAAMLFLAVFLAIRGDITPGDIILFLAMVSLLESQLTFIGSQFNSFAEAWGTVQESLKEVVGPQGVPDLPSAPLLSVSRGAVDFADVSFNYGGTQVFEHLSFSLRHGEKVGVIGRSGAGKSTLIKLIMRNYDLDAGTIRIDDTDISTITKESLRGSIALVPQDPALFHRSIHDNIAYGKPTASHEEVVEAARQAQAHDFIERLPMGYESLVGERGIKLSGGQRQRIAIARALLKDAPILLLDEATSALDSESEGLVQTALLKLMEGRTVVAIAHRLSTLRAMDRLLIFDAGKIVEDGTHTELIRKGGLYADLWGHQAGGFLED